MAAKDYETAYTSYMQAVDLIGTGPAVKAQRAEALGRFSKAGVAYAEFLIDHGRYSDAEKVAKTILLPQYNPNYSPAVTLLSRLEQPDYYNKTVTSQFAQDREQVAKLLGEAEGFYARGSYDLATKRYEQVLNIDHYNNAARLGMEKVNNARGKYYREAYNETRSRMLWQVQKGWELPIRHFTHGKDTSGSQTRTEASRTEAITAKLNRIIIPKIDMSDTTIREAIDYLHQLSVKLDTLEPDPAKKGVNIFLKLAASSSGGAGTGGLPGLGSEILPPALPPEARARQPLPWRPRRPPRIPRSRSPLATFRSTKRFVTYPALRFENQDRAGCGVHRAALGRKHRSDHEGIQGSSELHSEEHRRSASFHRRWWRRLLDSARPPSRRAAAVSPNR